METNRRPTLVRAHIPKMTGVGYAIEEWCKGMKKRNPAGRLDTVNSITLWPDQFGKVRAVIEWEDFGEEWILDYIVYVDFEKDVQKQSEAKGTGSI